MSEIGSEDMGAAGSEEMEALHPPPYYLLIRYVHVPRILEGTIPQSREPPTIDENECTVEDRPYK